jgi:hypothetical protein
MNARTWIASLPLLLLLAGCTAPLPAEKSAYAGHWQAQNMSLMIEPGGSVRYKRQQGAGSTSIEGPLKRFVGDDFEVGIGPMSTTFVVSQPPHQIDGQWKMVVDGVELTRVERGGR